MKRVSLGIAILMLLLLGVGGYFGYQQLQGSTGAVATAAPVTDVNRQVDDSVIGAEGRVVPARQATLSTLSGGAVAEQLVTEGDVVAAGDPLIRLEDNAETVAVRQAEATFALAVANEAAARARIFTAQLGVDASLLGVRNAEADLALLEAGVPAEQIRLGESSVAVADAAVYQAAGSRTAALEGAGSAQLAAAEAQVAFAQTAYDNAVNSYTPIFQNPDAEAETREQAGLRLNAAQAQLTAAQAALARLQQGATSAQQQAANSSVNVAANQRAVAQAQLDLLLTGPLTEQLTIAEAQVASAETAVAEAEGQLAGAVTAAAQAQAAVLEAQSGLEAAQAELTRRTLTAPFAGTVAAVYYKEGETVAAGAPVIVLADVSRWQIETTDLTELNIVDVAPGLPVAVYLDALPDVMLRGEVADIATAAVVQRGDVTYVITIDLIDVEEAPLRWGMTAFVNVSTAEDSLASGNVAPVAPVVKTEVEGRLVPQSSVNLAFNSGGRVTAIAVAEADVVAAGDTLITLEADALQLALAQANARVQAAEAGVAAAENQVALAETAVARANDGVVIAEANLALVQAGARPAEIAAAEAALAAAQSAISQAQAGRDVALDTISDADIASAEANLALVVAETRALEDSYQQIIDSCFETPDGQTICPLYGPVEEQTRAQLEVARANVAAAQALVNSLRAGPTSAQQTAAGGGVALAVANRNVAQAQLDLLRAGPRPEQIEKAEVGVAQAEWGVELAEATIVQAETAGLQAQAVLAAARAGRDALQVALDRQTLLAPFGGVVSDVTPDVGEMVAPGTAVITLADFSGWLVETTNVSELDIPHIAVGQSVDVRFDALPNQFVRGEVTKIATMPGQSQGEVVYQVTVQLVPVGNLPLRWGMTAFVLLDGR